MSGWKLCPLGQTEEMYDAISATGKLWSEQNSEKVWRVQAKAAPAPPEDVLERMAEAFLDHAYDVGLIPSWGGLEWKRQAIDSMSAALSAAEDRGEQASTSPPSEEMNHE